MGLLFSRISSTGPTGYVSLKDEILKTKEGGNLRKKRIASSNLSTSTTIKSRGRNRKRHNLSKNLSRHHQNTKSTG